ncbi:MAG: type 4a pilus biogenesis protein PilO [Gemmatimonadaceae bacterium]
MALLPQSPRDQRLFIVAVLAIGLAVVYQQLVWAPKNTELNTIQTRLDTLDSLNRLAQTEVAKGSATKMKQDADAFARELSVLRHLVPTENEVPSLLESISTAARHAGLEISDIAPDGVFNGDQYDTYRYKLGVTGPYHQVSEFLDNIGSMSRIVAPINLTLVPSGRVTEIKAKKGEQMLDARFGIQTYVAHASVKAPESVRPGAGKPGAP